VSATDESEKARIRITKNKDRLLCFDKFIIYELLSCNVKTFNMQNRVLMLKSA